MKIRSKRLTPLSARWRKLVLTQLISTPTKDTDKQIVKLWAAGYSHKDTAAEINGGA